ncbi:hypothetical protein J635_0279 [Acinetobacter baumannii 233846]|nr:hypothetical protein J635_0279 [Acinetobacter baumannii 233846]
MRTCKQNSDFLNGVCRHEPQSRKKSASAEFLNGVCRHEHASGFYFIF